MRRITFTIASLVIAGLFVAGSALAAGQQDKPVRAKSAAPASAGPAAPVNLNTATQAQLEALPGIGAATAKRIAEYRQKSGGFKKIEELMNVKGIGEKAFLKLKPHVTVASDKAGPSNQ
jgi:competence protein ComEA